MSDLDLTKPVQTRDGRPVRILCTDGSEIWPVIGLVAGNDMPDCWCANGLYTDNNEDCIDLVNVPEPTPVVLTEGQPYPVLWRGKYVDASEALHWAHRAFDADAGKECWRSMS